MPVSMATASRIRLTAQPTPCRLLDPPAGSTVVHQVQPAPQVRPAERVQQAPPEPRAGISRAPLVQRERRSFNPANPAISSFLGSLEQLPGVEGFQQGGQGSTSGSPPAGGTRLAGVAGTDDLRINITDSSGIDLSHVLAGTSLANDLTNVQPE